jgi:lysophospholipase L1-like esterase
MLRPQMSNSRLRTLLVLAALAAGCGGSNPSGPDATPTATPGSPVSGYVFYDENGNGIADAAEVVRLPGVTVAIGARTAQTTAGGVFTVDNVPNGAQSATVQPSSLPAYFVPGNAVSLTVPQATGQLAVPATLPLSGSARPNIYLHIGDSITVGDGSSNGRTYPDLLVSDLRSYWGKADYANEGRWGTRSKIGESVIGPALRSHRPAYALILYGTNDYNDRECKNEFPCYTIAALESMILQTRDAGAFPVLGTIPPANPAYLDLYPETRNDWVKRMNDLVRQLAAKHKVALADVHKDFLKQPNLSSLFYDSVHPNDAGYKVMSRSFFDAITKPVGTTSSSRRRVFGFSL